MARNQIKTRAFALVVVMLCAVAPISALADEHVHFGDFEAVDISGAGSRVTAQSFFQEAMCTAACFFSSWRDACLEGLAVRW